MMQNAREAQGSSLCFFCLGLRHRQCRVDECQNRQRWVDGMKPYAEKFYKSKAWQKTRNAYWKYKQGLCEICLGKGIIKPCEIVHHKVELTPENIDNPDVTLNWNNLQCVCRECHAMMHGAKEKRYSVDEFGRVIIR